MTGLAVFAATLAASFMLAEAWRRWAIRRGVLDVPGHRSSHAVVTPRGGGVGLALALIAALAWALPENGTRDAIIASIAAAGTLGLIDDLRPLRARWKFLGQIVASLPVCLALPFPVEAIAIPLPAEIGHGMSLGLVLLFLNAWNFMDGIDGIATLAAIAVCGVALIAGAIAGAAPAPLAALLLAACIGFLPLNAPRARLFMGDSGSHALGMAIVVLLLTVRGGASMWAVLAASSPFLIDVLGTLVRRALDGEPLATAHRRHLYQLVTRSGYSHARVSSAYALWMGANGGLVVMFEAWQGRGEVLAMVTLGGTALLWWQLSGRFERQLREGGQW